MVGVLLIPMSLVLFGFAAFRRSRPIALIGTGCLAISALAIARLNTAEYWKIDACLDHGGSYNYEVKQCEHE